MASAQTTGGLSKKTFHSIICQLSFHVEVMRKKTIKVIQLKMIFYTAANKDLDFPAEDFNFASFLKISIVIFPL